MTLRQLRTYILNELVKLARTYANFPHDIEVVGKSDEVIFDKSCIRILALPADPHPDDFLESGTLDTYKAHVSILCCVATGISSAQAELDANDDAEAVSGFYEPDHYPSKYIGSESFLEHFAHFSVAQLQGHIPIRRTNLLQYAG